jgi:very-short-patch-repair endonuclease
MMRLPATAVFGFHTAAALLGFGVLESESVHIVVPAGTAHPRIRGVVAHEAVLSTDDRVSVAGFPCTAPARTAIDLVRTVRRLDALPVLDAVLRTGRCVLNDLSVEAERHHGLRGVRQARELVPHADGRAECRQESQLRLLLLDAHLPALQPQVWVYDEAGAARYRIDLGCAVRRVGLEYDGVSHLDRHRLRLDRARMNWLDEHGWTMRYFTDFDLYRNPQRMIAQARAVLLP